MTDELKNVQRIASELRAKYNRERARLDALSVEREKLASALQDITAELDRVETVLRAARSAA